VIATAVRLPATVVTSASAEAPEPPERVTAIPEESVTVNGVVVLYVSVVAIPPIS